jgi:hypothetical protein
MSEKHLPLKVVKSRHEYEIQNARGLAIAVVATEENAAVFVRSVNAHDDLVKACEAAHKAIVQGHTVNMKKLGDELSAALAKAGTP